MTRCPRLILVSAAVLIATTCVLQPAYSQKISELGDLVGTRIRDAHPQMEQRGYQFSGLWHNSEYWTKSGDCIRLVLSKDPLQKVNAVNAAKPEACAEAAAKAPKS
jgi:hypothetical protein